MLGLRGLVGSIRPRTVQQHPVTRPGCEVHVHVFVWCRGTEEASKAHRGAAAMRRLQNRHLCAGTGTIWSAIDVGAGALYVA